jgi:hypothetical protein
MQKRLLGLTLITTMVSLVAVDVPQMPDVRTWGNMPMTRAHDLLKKFSEKMGENKDGKLNEEQLTQFEQTVFQTFDSAPERIEAALNILLPALRRKLVEKPNFMRWCKKRMDTTGQFLAFLYRTNDEMKQKESGITANRTNENGMHTNMYMINGETFFTWTGSKKHGAYHGHGKWHGQRHKKEGHGKWHGQGQHKGGHGHHGKGDHRGDRGQHGHKHHTGNPHHKGMHHKNMNHRRHHAKDELAEQN